MVRNQESPDTIVASGMRIEGELKSNGNIRIDGNVLGKVHTTKDLVVGQGAQIDADVLAANAAVGGIIKGNVTVKGLLAILETGKILGNIQCSTLTIREGAYFSGACRMNEPRGEITNDKLQNSNKLQT